MPIITVTADTEDKKSLLEAIDVLIVLSNAVDVKTEVEKTKPKAKKAEPKAKEPPAAEVTPSKAEVTPSKAEVTPSKAEVTPSKAEAVPSKADVRASLIALAKSGKKEAAIAMLAKHGAKTVDELTDEQLVEVHAATKAEQSPEHAPAKAEPSQEHASASLDDVIEALKAYSAARGRDKAVGLVQKHGVNDLASLSPDLYAQVIADCEAS